MSKSSQFHTQKWSSVPYESTIISTEIVLMLSLHVKLPDSNFSLSTAALKNCRCGKHFEHSAAMKRKGFNTLERHAGVARKLADNFPNIIMWQWTNHSLQPAVMDAAQHFSIWAIWKCFWQSCLWRISWEPSLLIRHLSIKPNSVGHMLGIRWTALFERIIPLQHHFQEA